MDPAAPTAQRREGTRGGAGCDDDAGRGGRGNIIESGVGGGGYVMDLTPANARFLAASIPTPLQPASSRLDAVKGKGCVSAGSSPSGGGVQRGTTLPHGMLRGASLFCLC